MLTKPQVLVAAKKKFMDQEQLSYIRQLLLEMKLSLGAVVSPISEANEQRFPDQMDQASQEEQWMVELKKRSMETDLLNDIDMALHRVDTGQYGYCELSGEAIDIKRLLANPVSRTTIEEQTRLEKQQEQAIRLAQ